MTTNKTTKRALLSSALALLLCFAMLLGTTFAWFTDEVTSSANKIVSGSLKIDLELLNKDTNAWESIKENKTPLFNYEKWEPGFVDAKVLKVENEGTLALKWKAKIVSAAPLSELADVIDVYVLPWGVRADDNLNDVKYPVSRDLTAAGYTRVGTVAEFVNGIEGTTKGELLEDQSAYLGIALKMQETAGNDYQETDLGAFDIQIVATQLASEGDSFGTDYDAGAEFDGEISNAKGLEVALTNGGTYEIVNNIVLANDATMTVAADKNVVLVMGNNTISGNNTKDTGALIVNEGDLTIKGGTVVNTAVNGGAAINNKGTMTLDDVTIEGASIADGSYPDYAVWTSGNLTIEDGTSISSDRGAISIRGAGETIINGGMFINNDIGTHVLTSHVVDVSPDAIGHSLTINGGTFRHLHSNTSGGVVICNRTTGTVNINGGNYSGGNYYGNNNLSDYGFGGTFAVTGGTFTTINNNYISEGYSKVTNNDGTYTVLPKLDSGLSLSSVANHNGLYTDGTNYYVYTAEGLISMRNFWLANQYGNNMWGRSYNVMADIDATGLTWDNVWVNVGSNDNEGFIFDGHGKTVMGLTIKDGLFSGTPNGGNKPNKPGYVQNITFDGVTVVGDHFTGVLWSNVYNELVVENVTVKNSTITGACNVAALVGGTVTEGGDATVTFKNCTVENNTITATGKAGQDPNGANVFLSRAFANTTVVFEGTNVAKNNVITNENGLVGGGVYGYTVWANGGFAATGMCDTFTNWEGITVVSNTEELTVAVANGAKNLFLSDGEYNVKDCGGKTLTISGSKNAVLKLYNEGESGCDYGFGSAGTGVSNVTFNGVTFNTTANTGDYKGYPYMNGTYNNCSFIGGYALFGESYFYNCNFNFKNNYVWTWGAPNVVFDGCTFEDENGVGKAILVHNTVDTTVTVKNCTFIAKTSAYTWDGLYVAAISIDPANGVSTATVKFEGTNTVITPDGASADANGNIGFAGLHQIKYSAESSRITVEIDGEKVGNIVATDYNPNL